MITTRPPATRVFRNAPVAMLLATDMPAEASSLLLVLARVFLQPASANRLPTAIGVSYRDTPDGWQMQSTGS
jgi:hypothetical protein